MKYILTASLLLLVFSSHSQSFNYQPLKAKGDIPEDFISNYLNKVAEQQEKLDETKPKKEREKDLLFMQVNEFMLDKHLTSGNIVYGDEVTNYLNKIVDKILAKHPDLRREIRVYTVRSSVFNAYTTNNGIIFVNLGLIAELETEAQLAYVLCHEIVHYVDRHVRESYDYRENVKRNKFRTVYDDEEIAKNYYSFSKEHEFEADEKGFTEFFDGLNYSSLAPFELMDIMLYAYLPFDEIPFELDCISTENFGVREQHLIDFEAKSISAEEDVDATMSSHPNILERKEALDEVVPLEKTGQDFIISKEDFFYIRNLCRYENLMLYLSESEYDKAVYQSFLLQKSFPDDTLLQRAIAYAMYGASVYTNYNSFGANSISSNKLEGQLSYVRNLLKKMDEEALNTLAVALTYEYYRDHPNDEFGEKIFKDALWELTHYYGKTFDFYVESIEVDTTPTENIKVREENLNTSRKVKTLKRKKTKKVEKTENLELETAFSSYLNDSIFKYHFIEMEEHNKEFVKSLPIRINKNSQEQLTLEELRNPNGSYQNNFGQYIYPNKKENIGGKGINKAFIITPEYYTFSVKYSSKVEFEKSAERQQKYVNSITENAKKQNIDYEFFDYKYLEQYDTEKFNEMQTLQRWYTEHSYHEGISIIHYMYTETKEIAQKYDTKYMIYSGMISLNRSGTTPRYVTQYFNLITSLFFLPSAPFIVGSYFLPSFDSYQFMHVVDLSNGNNVMFKENEGRHYRTNEVTDCLIYNQLLELSTKAKYKK